MMKLAALALSVAASPATAKTPLQIISLDADGGAATLFVTPEGKSLLVDTGWPDRSAQQSAATPPPPPATVGRVRAAMDQLGLKRLDYVLITHYHFDHVGGIADLLAQIPVGVVIDHGPNREAPPLPPATASPNHPSRLYSDYEKLLSGRERRQVKVGEALQIGSLKLTFVTSDGALIERPLGRATTPISCAGQDKPRPADENDRSLGFVASFGRARILDLGDLLWDQERRLVCPVNKLGAIDVLLVTHHGSELSNSPALIEAITPRVAIVQNGARKGGDRSVYQTLTAAQSKPAIWYQHFATRTPEANPAGDFIANPEAATDTGHALQLQVWRDGRVTVTNARNGHKAAYPPR